MPCTKHGGRSRPIQAAHNPELGRFSDVEIKFGFVSTLGFAYTLLLPAVSCDSARLRCGSSGLSLL